MKNVQGRREAPRSKGLNPILGIGPLDLARSFLVQTPALKEEYPRLMTILSLIGDGSTAAGFSQMLDPSEYAEDEAKFVAVRQFNALVSKVVFRGDLNPRAAAIEASAASEKRCGRTNRRIRYWRSKPLAFARRYPDLDRVINFARSYIADTLGPLTPDVYQCILRLSRPGPGLALGSQDRSRTSPFFKWTDTKCIAYPKSVPIARDFFLLNPKLGGYALQEVGGRLGVETVSHNRQTWVPKNSKTLRAIAIEASFPLLIQLGIHEWMRVVFKRRGVADLGNQELNQLLAYLGSTREGLDSFSTIDLSAASDSLAYELVAWLLPDDWFYLLDALRAPATMSNGTVTKAEKFSSMGNGYTFALETLIFKALSEGVRALVGGELTSVYGDDIIVPCSNALMLIDVLKMVGFEANAEKSFVFGPFKESCGADWLRGTFVTPVYVRSGRIRVTDAQRLYNLLPYPPVKEFIRRELARAGSLHWGLPNEDPASCLFGTLAQCQRTNSCRWNSSYQTWEFRALTQVGAQHTPRSEIEPYLSALLHGRADLPKRGVVKTRLVWKSAGRTAVGAWL